MPQKPAKPRSASAPDYRLSMRLSDQALVAIDEHKRRLDMLNGTEVSKSQAVESLLAVGALVWRAVERTGSWSPTALVDAGERVQLEERAALEAHLKEQRAEREARTGMSDAERKALAQEAAQARKKGKR